jgi:mono/diheme cytochrome c family protein
MAATLGLIASGSAAESLAAEKTHVGNARAGLVYATKTCSDCHDVKAQEDHRVSIAGAPSFHAIAKTSTALSLNAFLTTPHPTMPNLMIGERDRHDVVAYILSLKDVVKALPL